MKKQIVLITGASRGLGKALSEKYVEEQCTVISGVRDTAKAPKGTYPVFLDLTNEESLNQAVDDIIKTYGKIDILIHNAGIAYVGPVDSMTMDEARNLFEVNFFGPLRLTQLILPHMRKQQSGKILFVSSVRAVDSGAYIGLYSASKSALETAAFDWAVTLSKWNISVSIAQPGPIDTGIQLLQGQYFQTENPYPPLGDVVLDLQPVNEVCKAIVEQLKGDHPPFKFQSNREITEIVAKHVTDPSGNEWLQSQIKDFHLS